MPNYDRAATSRFSFLATACALGSVVLLPAAKTAPAPLTPAASAAPLSPAVEAELKDKDHKNLGKDLALYFEANATKKGLTDAIQGLEKSLGKIEKKLKGGDPLALTEDLGRSLWYAQEYDKVKGLKKGKIQTYELDRPWDLEYSLHLPKKYNPKQSYPLLLCIPPAGKKVSDHLVEDWIDAELRDEALIAIVSMPDDAEMWDQRGSPDKPGGGGNVRIVYGDITLKCAVDFDRVFLVGTGEGVATAVSIAAESPDWFAGVIGRSGDVAADMRADNFANLPSLFISAGKGATEFSERAKELEVSCTLKSEGGEKEILEWVRETSRQGNPQKVTFVTDSPYVNKAYWIEMPRAEGERRIEASVDRESNTITITGKGSESVTLLLNDLLVDLERPVKVVCNGLEHVNEIPRNRKTMLDMMYKRRSDPGKVYVARNTYDLAASPD